MQGLLGIGALTGRQELVEAAARSMDGLLQRLGPDGFLAGRFGLCRVRLCGFILVGIVILGQQHIERR